MSTIIDAGKLMQQGELFSARVRAVAATHVRELGWDAQTVAEAMLAVAWGFCRRAGWSHETMVRRFEAMAKACERSARGPGRPA